MAKTKKVAARVSIQRAQCEVFSTAPFECPLCHQQVPANTHHHCRVDGGVREVTNRPVKDIRDLEDC